MAVVRNVGGVEALASTLYVGIILGISSIEVSIIVYASFRQANTDEWTSVQRWCGRSQIRCQLWLSPRDRISYTTNHSILWAIIHGIFSWLYVIYFALFRA